MILNFSFLSIQVCLNYIKPQKRPQRRTVLNRVNLNLHFPITLCRATNCSKNFLGCFSIVIWIASASSFSNLMKRWAFKLGFKTSISRHNLISFGKPFQVRGPHIANITLPKGLCFNMFMFRYGVQWTDRLIGYDLDLILNFNRHDVITKGLTK